MESQENELCDDLFDSVIMSEEQSQKAGFQEGVEAGKAAGLAEGNKLGWEKGSAIGSEVGLYYGFAKTLLKELEKDPSFKPRAVKPLTKLVQLIEHYQLSDPHNPNLQTGLEEIRTKFKQVTAVMGIKPETPNRDSSKGISF